MKNRTRMSLRSFIKSVFNKLISNSFGSDCMIDPEGECSFAQESLNVIPEFYTIEGTKLNQTDMLASNINYEELRAKIRDPQTPIHLTDYEEGLSYQDYRNVIIYQARGPNTDGIIQERDFAAAETSYITVAQKDQEEGIYHLNIGSDKGLVKTIQFSRMDQTYLREARMQQAESIGAFSQIRERYNATVTMYGNQFFYPGQYIYVNPSMVGVDTIPDLESITTKLGLGGYFLIVKVEHIIESGLYETILTCSWTHSGFATTADGNTADTLCGASMPGRVHSMTDYSRYL